VTFVDLIFENQNGEVFYGKFQRNGVTYSMDDTVLVTRYHTQVGPVICSLLCIYKNERDEIRLECKLYHRPNETSIGRCPYHGKTEIFDSDHFEIYDASQVIEKCTIESESEYRKRTEFPNNVFYKTEFYDFSIEKVVPNKDHNVSLRRKILDQKREQNEVHEEGIQNIQMSEVEGEKVNELARVPKIINLIEDSSDSESKNEREEVTLHSKEPKKDLKNKELKEDTKKTTNQSSKMEVKEKESTKSFKKGREREVEYNVDKLPAMNESEDVNKHEKENEKENESENEKMNEIEIMKRRMKMKKMKKTKKRRKKRTTRKTNIFIFFLMKKKVIMKVISFPTQKR